MIKLFYNKLENQYEITVNNITVMVLDTDDLADACSELETLDELDAAEHIYKNYN